MNQLVAGNPQGNLPAFIKQTSSGLANQMSSGLSQSYPSISLKGGRFTFNKGSESTPWSEFTLDVIIVGASNHIQRTYYAGVYDPNAKDAKPTCSSQNGEYPSVGVEQPQSQGCQVCPMNQKQADPQRPGQQHTPCGFSKNLAVMIPGDQNGDIWRLSLNSMTLFGKSDTDTNGVSTWRGMVEKFVSQNADPLHYVVRLSFDPEHSVPVLKFQIIGVAGDGSTAYDETFYNLLTEKLQMNPETGESEATKVVGDNMTDVAALPANTATSQPITQPVQTPQAAVDANVQAGAPIVPVAEQGIAQAGATQGVIPQQAAAPIQQPVQTAQPIAQPQNAAVAPVQQSVVQPQTETPVQAVVHTPAEAAIQAAQAAPVGTNPAQAAINAAAQQTVAATPQVAAQTPAQAAPAEQVADSGIAESDEETANLLAAFGTPAQ